MNFRRAILATVVVVVGTSVLLAKDPPGVTVNKGTQSLGKVLGEPRFTVLNINDFLMWTRSDGYNNHTPADNSGGFYPRGTAGSIYLDSFVWGAKAYVDSAFTTEAADQVIRLGGGTYNIATRAGRILGTGASAVPEATDLPNVRTYRVRRDYASMTLDELKRDASELLRIPVESVTDAQAQDVYNQYDLDWKNWPVSSGAPFIDRNNNGVFDAPPAFTATFNSDSLVTQGKDEPGVAGADKGLPAGQVIWTVYNDLSPSLVNGFSGSLPMGIEIQKTTWGYKASGEIGSLYFQRIKMINKGGVVVNPSTGALGTLHYDSVFVCQWSDPDLGDFGDDLVGSDTVLNVGYVYNGQGRDVEYQKFGLRPPAVGYDFLAGPAVNGDPTDSAFVDFRIVYGKKNLGMTSFAYFSAGASISDPPFSREGGLRWWRMLQGYVPDPSTDPLRYYPHPPGVAETQFPLSGDPTTGIGFLDGQGTDYSLAPGDRRLLMNTGPFTLRAGETQEIVMGVVGGSGADRISSIAVMKRNDQVVQNIFNSNFVVPPAPPAPTVVASEVDEAVVLEWGSDTTRVGVIERPEINPGQFRFEGYKVYQLPRLGARLEDGLLIGSYDIKNTVGDNTGIARSFIFDRDYLKDIGKLWNGQEYFLAVTSYVHSAIPGYVPLELQSAATVFRVVPQKPLVGQTVPGKYQQSITVTKQAGPGNGTVAVEVINPKAITGDRYEVRFTAPDSIDILLDPTDSTTLTRVGNHKWRLWNATKNQPVTAASGYYDIAPDNIIADGIRIGVSVAPYYVPGKELASYSVPSHWQPVNWGGTFYSGAIDVGANFLGSGLAAYEVDKSVEIRYINNPGQTPTGQKAYRYLRNTSSGGALCDSIFTQPFTVWDVTNPSSPRQLNFAFFEQVGNAERDGIFAPTLTTGGRAYFFFPDWDYDNGTDVNAQVGKTYNQALRGGPVLWAGWVIRRAGSTPYNAGDVFNITATIPVEPVDIWTFNTASLKMTTTAEKAKADVEKNIYVYPNPYYAFNQAEISRLNRFVTIYGLPQRATLRIFNVAGQLVRVMQKDDASQFIRWSLTNNDNFPVASGMYIIHIDMPDVGGSSATKILKAAIIQEQEILDVF